MKPEEVRKTVRSRYGGIARSGGSCCGPSTQSSGCCGGSGVIQARSISKNIGYSDDEMNAVPDGANLGLGCGNPVALASLKEGEVVLDLGSGAGFDCFLAAKRVGASGKVIGVDMTPDMLEKARDNARKGGYQNVEFRLGEIENLPVADSAVDAIISNCVINLSPDKPRVFAEAFRVLKPGGRLMVSDIALLGELPDALRNSIEVYVGCIAGALQKADYLAEIKQAGFTAVEVVEEKQYPLDFVIDDPEGRAALAKLNITHQAAKTAAEAVISIRVSAVKPGK